MNILFQLFPESASIAAGRIDVLFLALLLLISVVALALAIVGVVFCIRYRAGSRANRGTHARGGDASEHRIEITWIAVTLVVFLGMFGWAAFDFVGLYENSSNATRILVVAKQWMWTLQHANGKREIDELHVPLGQPVRLVMTSQDVIHSFYVPAFRIKEDVLPGRYTSIGFTATKLGEFHLFCAEYCGTDHSRMVGRVVVMPPAEFARWLESGDAQPDIVARGFDLYRRYGCSGCHEPGSTVHAPDLRGLLGRMVHLQDGRSVVADESYVYDSMLLPNKDVVAGYAPIMPSFMGQISEEDAFAIIEYIRSTGSDAPGARRDKESAHG